MPRAKRTIDYTLSETPKLSDLREIVAETQSAPSDSSIQIVAMVGQHESTYYHIVITDYGVASD